MALFKIFNNIGSTNPLPRTHTEGFCYFDARTNLFYIDIASDVTDSAGNIVQPGNRIILNAYGATISDSVLNQNSNINDAEYIWRGTKAEYDALPFKDPQTLYITIDDSHPNIGQINGYVQVQITPVVADVDVILTNSTNPNIVYQGKTNASGLCNITLPTAGYYLISFGDPTITSQTSGVNMIKGYTHYINAQKTGTVEYSIKIDESNSNPLTRIIYEYDAIGMTKGSADWDSKPIFNQIKPCMLKNGVVQYYLDKNDFNKKEDGSPADLSGADGDVMIQFPKFAYRIYREPGSQILHVSVTNDSTIAASDSRYHYYAFSRNSEGDQSYFYRGAFKGWVDENNKLRSLPGKQPTASKNINEFEACAEANGIGYTQSGYQQLVAIQCLYLIKYGTFNGQVAVGQGYVSASAATLTGQTLDKGMFYGTNSGTQQVKVFGIEDFWGNIWEWIIGFTTGASREVITDCGGQQVTTPTGLTANISGWAKGILGTTEAGFMPYSTGGSSTTYTCDYFYLYASCVLYFGGNGSDGASAGPFRLSAADGASAAYASVGARLQFC